VRKIFYWYVPAAAALIATLIFATGFYSYLNGDTGTQVSVATTAQSGQPGAAVLHQMVAPIILGDSLARGTGDSTGLGIGGRFVEELQRRKVPTKEIVNIAINGARTADLLQQLDHHNIRVLLGQSNAIIISIGGNDLWGDNMRNAPTQNPEPVMNAVMERLQRVVAIVREANPTARIYVIGLYNPFISAPFGKLITPLVRNWNARLTERFASDPNIVIVQTSDIFAFRDRLSEDRFHPSGEGYELIARRIADTF
jgi:lysophospholipase L1-like esterase